MENFATDRGTLYDGPGLNVFLSSNVDDVVDHHLCSLIIVQSPTLHDFRDTEHCFTCISQFNDQKCL